MRLYWLFATLLLGIALAGIHQVALEHYLYWRYLWLDTPMHALGGIAIGTFIMGILPVRRKVPYVILCIAAFVGWEIFEYVAKVPQAPYYALDTMKDLCMDTVGALIVYLVARKTLWQ